jgi:histidinol-phosphate/aromatic aminotransferase/cobyric acid decarboxylase-like protein
MVKLAGGEPVHIEAGFEQNFKITADQLEAAITPKTRMLILCSPSNPTGSVYSKEELRPSQRSSFVTMTSSYLQMKSMSTLIISANTSLSPSSQA